jgi:hypothetical protein
MDEKIPSYKYKFKQIFKEIGQAKALDLFYFVAVLTWTVKVKNKHISVGLSNCRIIATLPCFTVHVYGVLHYYNSVLYFLVK